MNHLKSLHLPLKLILWGGPESKFCADVLYQYCKDADLIFVVPLYVDVQDRIREYMKKRYPQIMPVYVPCLTGCGNDGVMCACDTVLEPFKDMEHVNICPGSYDYTSISRCDQCNHIIPNQYGLVRPCPDGTRGRVWNYYPFFGYSEKDICDIIRVPSIGLSQAVCPMCRDKLIAWWNAELARSGI